MRIEKPNRRWHQFSLKTLLIVLSVSCVVFAWIGWRMHRARENRSRVAAIETTVAAIKELGGRARTFHANVRGPTWLEEQFDDPGGADDPVFILEVDFVEIGDRRVTVADLEHLKALEHLKFLVLTGSSVNDTHLENLLENLNEFATLQILSLIGTKVTDAGVENLQKALPNCKIQRFP